MSRKTAFSLKWIKSFWMILFCMVSGIAAGLYVPELAHAVSRFGDLYLSFLKMCVIPIMMTAIISSIGSLLIQSGAMKMIVRMCLVYTLALVFCGLLGLSLGGIGRPGAGLPEESKHVLGAIVYDLSADTSSLSDEKPQGVFSFLLNMIPSNIFTALTENNTLQILFFSVIVGVAVGMMRTSQGEDVLKIADVLFGAFQKVISWSMYALPFALFCMMAGQFATLNMDILPAMMKLIMMFYISSVILIVLSLVIMAVTLRKPVRVILSALKDTLILAFGTRNSIATVPTCMDALSMKLQQDSRIVQLVVPLGMIMCRYSMVLVYTLGITFTVQLYEFDFTLSQWIVVLAGAVVISIAGAGSPGVVSIGMIAIIAGMLGLPSEVTIILLLAMNPIIDPIITAANVSIQCLTTSLLSARKENYDHYQTVNAPGQVEV
ncbi:cation:dicarboxylase symporter family transporter [Paenibacillus sp. ClWae2A]|uniref:dicarboxylate/amino acid:cation symporter n=1 Tax=Paenibacillus sp. ClWae2A TaxID=3057177 RepID=UPI0028F55BB7|nr:cation:dicarboxylase symporter family transporter [Paenibacillus sp. ClWae2A]MDT9721986.1 cation:dicarboxylase symporter family transporter [Paenibacillus sp. ClWae2A]